MRLEIESDVSAMQSRAVQPFRIAGNIAIALGKEIMKTDMNFPNELITETWLAESGFRWHQMDRQPHKQWLLWLGSAIEDSLTSVEDIGVEVSRIDNGDGSPWHCWLRRDSASRYSRFIHIRNLTCRRDLIRLIEGVTGVAWNPANNFYGAMYTEKGAQRVKETESRLDRQFLLAGPKWSQIEEDDTRGRALPEHAEEAVKRGGAQ